MAILQTADRGYLLGGYSYSDTGGDKTTANYGGYDYWVVKIDSLGNKLWDKDYGGSADDQLYSLASTHDGGYLLAGTSQSQISGDKSENNSIPNAPQTWLIKADSAGNKLWDKTIFVNGGTTLATAFETNDGDYFIGSFTPAEIGFYKSQPSWDSSDDCWMIKFRDTTIITGINEITDVFQYNAYPNPFTNELDITISQQNLTKATFTITNLLGETIYNQHESNLSHTYTKMLDLSYLANGVYLVSVTVNGERIVKEVVKE